MRGKKWQIRNRLRNAKRPQNPLHLASCYGKIQHKTYDQAKAAADLKPSIVKPYKCKFGTHYHIGRRASI